MIFHIKLTLQAPAVNLEIILGLKIGLNLINNNWFYSFSWNQKHAYEKEKKKNK